MFVFTKRRVGWFMLVGIVALFVIQLSNPRPAKAATLSEYGVTNKDRVQDAVDYAEWIDAAHVKVRFKNGKELVFEPTGEKNNGGSNLRDERLSNETGFGVEYGKVTPALDCFAAVKFDINENKSSFEKQSTTLETGTIDIDFRPNADSDCVDGNEFEISIRKPELSIAYFKWYAPNQIGMVDGDFPGKFTKGTSTAVIDGVTYDVFLSDREAGAESCRDKLVLNKATNKIMWYQLGSSDGNPPDEISTTCGYNDENDIESFPRNNYLWGLANTAENVKDQPPSSGLPDGETGGPTGTECVDRFNTFGVVVCWILEGVDAILSLIESTVANLLEVNVNNFSTSENRENTPLYVAWLGVVRVSSGLLAIIAISMVLGTALGGYRAFDAYTVKKVLPRIVIAAIAMWLSWALVTAYIGAINTIGRGIADIMWEPFAAEAGTFEDWGLAEAFGDASTDTGRVSESVTGFGIISGVAFSTGALAAGGAWAVLSALMPVLLFMLIGFIVLILRQAIIVFLIVVAPLAIVSWVLPNTKNIWDKWSKFLNQLLIMFPLFMAILAAGKIFAYVAGQSGDSGLFSLLIPIIAYVTPYALLPSIFKSSGGALSKVTGTVSKLGGKATGGAQKTVQGLADARKKVRAEDRVTRGRVAQGLGYKVPFTDRRLSSTAGIAQALERSRRGQPLKPLTDSSKAAAALGASRAAQEQISAMQKDIDQVLGGDLSARKAIASGQTMDQIRASDASLAERLESSGATRFVGDRYAQAASTLGLAQIGKVDESHIRAAAEKFKDDKQTASALVNQASRAAKSSGQTSLGSLRYDYDSSGVGYEGMVTNPRTGNIEQGIAIDPRLDVNGNPTNPEYITARNESVAKSIASMSAIDQAGLAVDGGAFKDTVVTEALRSNPALATQILNDENVKLTASQRQALINAGAIPNQSSGSGTVSTPPNATATSTDGNFYTTDDPNDPDAKWHPTIKS